MQKLVFEHQGVLDAFMKTAQYLASLPTHDDIWGHVKEVMVKFYNADLVAFAGPVEDGRVKLHHLVLPSDVSRDLLEADEFQEVIREVLESGFLSWRLLTLGNPYAVIFLPVNLGNETAAVMLVGHASTDPLSNELLNVYLA
ncbi:MAG: PAS sensor protein, partial [Deltaproteobacteria bacterium]|nr:PAS sensor protein [Deltaproteobacteria bacterium]